MFDPDTFGWVLASKGANTEAPSFLRFCRVPERFLYSEYPQRIHIHWTMRKPDKFGLPTPEEDTWLDEFESLVTQSMLPANHAVLVLAQTRGGIREFVFYSKDVDEFMSRLQHMPHRGGPFPIVLEQFHDPEWSYYREFALRISEA